jgi:hypothetical protein
VRFGRWAYVNWVPSAGGVEDNFYVNDEVKAIFKDHMKTLVNRVNSINGKVRSKLCKLSCIVRTQPPVSHKYLAS